MDHGPKETVGKKAGMRQIHYSQAAAAAAHNIIRNHQQHSAM